MTKNHALADVAAKAGSFLLTAGVAPVRFAVPLGDDPCLSTCRTAAHSLTDAREEGIAAAAGRASSPAPPSATLQEDSMVLVTLNEPGTELAGGIRFMMTGGVGRVVCWVSREALDDIEGGHPSQHERTARFERHRPKIERLASQKYDAGEKSPIVLTFDLGTLR